MVQQQVYGKTASAQDDKAARGKTNRKTAKTRVLKVPLASATSLLAISVASSQQVAKPLRTTIILVAAYHHKST
jgi:hypothetical protein